MQQATKYLEQRERDLRIVRHPGSGALADKIEAKIKKEDRDYLRRIRGQSSVVRACPDLKRHKGTTWVVYFVLSPQLQRVKIGTSQSLQNRFKALCDCAPERFVFLGWIPGGVAVERALHHKLADCRAHGEWFHCGPALAAELRRFGIKLEEHDPLFS